MTRQELLSMYGKPGQIPLAKVKCTGDEFENAIRIYGVGNACEFFGHRFDSDFTIETIEYLFERSDV